MPGRPAGNSLRRLVLAGGGHAHAFVLRSLAAAPLAGAQVTLVAARERHTYSGMVPGCVAGHYALEQIQIDLKSLADRAGAKFVIGRIAGIDSGHKKILLGNGAELAYDLASLNLDSLPDTSVPGSAKLALAAKPFERFLESFDPSRALRVAVIGAGAAGVELAMATHHRSGAPVTLFSEKSVFSASLGRRVAAALSRNGVRIRPDTPVTSVEPGPAVVANRAREAYDLVVWAAGAAPIPWLRSSGLATDARGFVLVDATLRSVSHPEVFAVGDCATLAGAAHPKSGVYAVRHGAVLAENLRRCLAGKRLKNYIPQSRSLSLISCGAKYAIAQWGGWTVEGAWVWRWKDWLDRRWIGGFR